MNLIAVHRITSLHIPLFGESVRCGFPSPAQDYQEETLDFNDLLVKNPVSTYCLRISGSSMTDAGIDPGDLIVVDRSMTPGDGDIIVAALDGDFTVKRLIRHRGEVLLRAAHPDYPDIEIESEQELSCFGVVTSVIKILQATTPLVGA